MRRTRRVASATTSPAFSATRRCGSDGLSRQQDAAPAEDQSWREAVFALALGQFLADDSVADRTKRIFERVALNGEPPEVVAASFKMKRHAVDQAKSRALARLREIVKSLEGVANG